jgi:hypothetical protein
MKKNELISVNLASGFKGAWCFQSKKYARGGKKMFIKRYSNNGCLDLRPMIFGNS